MQLRQTAHLRRIATVLSLAISLLGSAKVAHSEVYQEFLVINSEDDIDDLFAAATIDEDERDELKDLLLRGVDLNTATRAELFDLPNISLAQADAIIAYRKESGKIYDPIDLVVAGALTADELQAIAAFLLVGPKERSAAPFDGMLKIRGRTTAPSDDSFPAAFVMGRATTLQHLSFGFALVENQHDLANVKIDTSRDALSAENAGTSFHLPKVYVSWSTDSWEAIAGTYRIGFGERLTFDNTLRARPEGFDGDMQLVTLLGSEAGCSETAGELGQSPCNNKIVTPDFAWRQGLLGAALSLKRLELGRGWLAAHAFASYKPYDAYQYTLYRPDRCEDPHSSSAQCDSPDVYHREGDISAPQSQYAFETLPNIFAERLAGANVTYGQGATRVGLTGYAADIDFLLDGMALDFQEWARFPRGGAFGAVGLFAGAAVHKTDLSVEATQSFDETPGGGGGMGAISRAITRFDKRNSLDISIRYYDEDFVNPHARAIAAPDVLDGQRVRDELGLRVKYSGNLDKRHLPRAILDLWRNPGRERNNIKLDLSFDERFDEMVRVGIFTRYSNIDTANAATDGCLTTEILTDGSSAVDACGGERYRVGLLTRLSPVRKVTLEARAHVEEVVEAKTTDDLLATLSARFQASSKLTFQARVRYLQESIDDDAVGEESLWTYLRVGVSPLPKTWFRARYDIFQYLDGRAITDARDANPEHWFWLEAESRF